jgi:hypothetical protein
MYANDEREKNKVEKPTTSTSKSREEYQYYKKS